MFDLTGRVALVTGAGQHVGAGIAETLAECGATVVVNDLYPDRAETEAKAIVAAGGKATAAAFGRIVTISSGAGTQGLKIGASTYAGTGRDVGAAVVWLAAEGEWVTGQTIAINGGSSTT